MKEVLNIHNSNSLCGEQICDLLDSLGYNADYDVRISRTLIYSDAPKSVVNKIIDLIFHCNEVDTRGDWVNGKWVDDIESTYGEGVA